MSDFLPEGYSIPKKANNYMKLEDGENRFRILDKAIIGYKYWVTTKDGKSSPRRVRMDENIPMDEIEREGDPKHFWAMPVYNFNLGKIQILEVTQKSIQSNIMALVRNKKFGSPENYTLSITKTGEKKETRYTILPEPRDEGEEKLLVDVKKEYKEMQVDLEALFRGEDPFAASSKEDDIDYSKIL